jgi:LysR family transcriptional regulator, cys regulon transcriptional activator
VNLQQLRAVREAIRCNFNLTQAAERLFTSQPGVSKQIRELEDELGVQIFIRHGKRFVGLTDPGRDIVPVIERLLEQADNLKSVARELSDNKSGSLRIATTHTQARYALPRVIAEFKRRFPNVQLVLQQGSPRQLAEMVLAGEADLAIATEALDRYPGLIALPGQLWSNSVIVPVEHPLASVKSLSLEAIVPFPIVTYDLAFSGRAHIDAAFASHGLTPNVVLAALDADLIKTYVEVGLGVGIVASMAYEPERDRGLAALDASHLFEGNMTRVALKRDAYVRSYTFTFIEQFTPSLTRKVVERALAGEGSGYEL